MVKTITYACDICGSAADHHQKNVPIKFLTEQTEGRYTKPHISMETLDLCDRCLVVMTDLMPVEGVGAQGHNKYSWRKGPDDKN